MQTPPPAPMRAAYTPPAYQPGPAPGVRYSGRAARFVAYLIDGFITGLVVGILYLIGFGLIAGGAVGDSGPLAIVGIIIVVVAIVVGVAYRPWYWVARRPDLRLQDDAAPGRPRPRRRARSPAARPWAGSWATSCPG